MACGPCNAGRVPGKKQELQTLMKFAKLPIIWVVGGPSSGKTPVCKAVAKKFHFSHVSVGALIRQHIKTDNKKGPGWADIVNAGGLVETDDVIDMLIMQMLDEAVMTKGFLINGFPRSIEQGEAFKMQIGNPDMIIHIDVKPETMLMRTIERAEKSPRPDDEREIIHQRVETFYLDINPLMEHFGGDLVKVVPGSGPIEDVFGSVSLVLNDLIDHLERRNLRQ